MFFVTFESNALKLKSHQPLNCGNTNYPVLVNSTLLLDLTFQELWALLIASFVQYKPL